MTNATQLHRQVEADEKVTLPFEIVGPLRSWLGADLRIEQPKYVTVEPGCQLGIEICIKHWKYREHLSTIVLILGGKVFVNTPLFSGVPIEKVRQLFVRWLGSPASA